MSVKLPSDWSIKKLADVADVVSGGTPSRDIADFWFPDEIEWVTPTDITRGDSRTLDFAKEKISINGLNNSSAK
jgi:type I restriction enzyme S subunit